jgi:hypothetical protein
MSYNDQVGQRGDKCVECKRWVNGPCKAVEAPAHRAGGTSTSTTRRNVWHSACWDQVQEFAATSKATAEAERLQELADLRASLGLPA